MSQTHTTDLIIDLKFLRYQITNVWNGKRDEFTRLGESEFGSYNFDIFCLIIFRTNINLLESALNDKIKIK